jgi:hypothetical protein
MRDPLLAERTDGVLAGVDGVMARASMVRTAGASVGACDTWLRLMSPDPFVSAPAGGANDGGGAYDGGIYGFRAAVAPGLREEGGTLGDGGGRLVRCAARAAISASEVRFSEALLGKELSAMRTSP